MNLREASVEILRRLRTADEEAASVGPESQARFDRKVAALEVTHSDEQQTQLENQKESKEQGVQAIESAYRKQRADLEQQYRAQHESLKEEATRSLQDGQKQKAALLEAKKEQIWLAETVFESSEDKPGEKFALTASTIRNQCRALKKQEEELRTRIRRIWASGAAPEETECPESLDAFVQHFQDVVRSADSSKAAPAAEWGNPRHLIGDFYRHRRGDWPHRRFTRSVSRRGIWFGHDHDCRGLGFQEQTSPATPTPRGHQPATSGTDGRAGTGSRRQASG